MTEVQPTVQTVPNKLHVGRSAQVPTIYALCTAANSKGKSVPVPAINSAPDIQMAIKFLRPLCTAYSLPVPKDNLDMMSITTLCNTLATAIG